MSRWRYNGEQLAAIDVWIEKSAPHELVYLPRLRGDGVHEALAVVIDEDPAVLPLAVCYLEVHPDGRITQTDGVVRWWREEAPTRVRFAASRSWSDADIPPEPTP